MVQGGDALGAVHDNLSYALTLTGVEAQLRVASFLGAGALSTLFTYEIVVVTAPEVVDSIIAALGEDASFSISRDGQIEHEVFGVIARVEPDGAKVGEGLARTTVVLRPRLALLQLGREFRIFQNLGTVDIVTQLLDAEQIVADWRMHPVPEPREYCTQFGESDYDFICRLVAEEGAHFFFETADGVTKVVFTNDSTACTTIDGDWTFPFRGIEGAVTTEHVRTIVRRQVISAGAFEHRDYDLLRPQVPIVADFEAPSPLSGTLPRRLLREYPGRFVDASIGADAARVRMEETLADTLHFNGSATTVRLLAGRVFTVTDHPEGAFNARLLVTGFLIKGEVSGAFWQHADGARGDRGALFTDFTAVPADAPIHPKPTPRPPSRLQTARVVGPNDGDPYVDELGRIKVQFPWDRVGAFDEQSSCWMRQMMLNAHQDEGFFSAHKVGSEVLVDFLDGDIDRPIVMGAVYNGLQTQPYAQPSDVAKSSWKVKSIPGGNGYNELTFDNTAGKEQILLHAQKNLVETILHDHTESIGASQSSSVGGEQSVSVSGNRTLSVTKNHTINVTKNETTSIAGSRTESVNTGESVAIKNGRSHVIATGDDALAVGAGNRSVSVSGTLTALSNQKAQMVKTTYDLAVGTSITIHHNDDAVFHLEAGVASLGTSQKITLSNPSGTISMADGTVTITAAQELILGSGASKISLKQDGTLSVSGGASVGLACGGATVKLEPAQATVNGPAVNVTASGALELSGALIKLN